MPAQVVSPECGAPWASPLTIRTSIARAKQLGGDSIRAILGGKLEVHEGERHTQRRAFMSNMSDLLASPSAEQQRAASGARERLLADLEEQVSKSSYLLLFLGFNKRLALCHKPCTAHDSHAPRRCA